MTYPFGTAYAFTSSAQHREYYDRWAGHYDAEFAELEGYDFPGRVAALWQALAVDNDVPVADIGCGTGLVGLAIVSRVPDVPVHGFDISRAMLDIARSTGAYVDVTHVDLTSPDDLAPGQFGAVISAGAFTLGHLGPDVLRTVIAMGRPSALFVLGINRKHFLQADFASVLDRLHRSDAIGPWQVTDVPIFGEAATEDPARIGSVVHFRRAVTGT